jgi:hypothetical protein
MVKQFVKISTGKTIYKIYANTLIQINNKWLPAHNIQAGDEVSIETIYGYRTINVKYVEVYNLCS